MDAGERKLAIKLGDADAARALVKAGLNSPAKIRAASDATLDAVIGKAKRQAVRGKIKPRAK